MAWPMTPKTRCVVTSGGTEALAACIMAMAVPGDEIVLIEPTYDSYRPIAEAAGAVVKTVKLAPPRLAPDGSRRCAPPSRPRPARC